LIGAVYGKQGASYLRRTIRAFNRSAAGAAYLVLTDLDRTDCAPDLIENWFGCRIAEYPNRCHPNMLFRVAVRETEAWVMADRDRFARFLGIRVNSVPHRLDEVGDPKRLLLDLARRCRSRELRNDIVPRPGDRRIVGPDYTGRLAGFIASSWRAEAAQTHSNSLFKAFDALKRFRTVPQHR
jgi:hypothetical protein